MLRLAFDFIITWRETRTRPNAYVQPADGVYTLTLPARSVVSYTGTVLSSSSL